MSIINNDNNVKTDLLAIILQSTQKKGSLYTFSYKVLELRYRSLHGHRIVS